MYILRVNMADQTYSVEDLPEKYRYLAGRALTSKLISDEVPPEKAALNLRCLPTVFRHPRNYERIRARTRAKVYRW